MHSKLYRFFGILFETFIFVAGRGRAFVFASNTLVGADSTSPKEKAFILYLYVVLSSNPVSINSALSLFSILEADAQTHSLRKVLYLSTL